MRAVICRTLGGPEVLSIEEQPAPEPGACHIRIAIEAAGVNFADLLMLKGRYQERPQLPFTPGLEIAGVITAVGVGVIGFEPGQRVLALLDHGGFAQEAIARADDVIVLPASMDMTTAAGFAIAYGTAYGALAWRADLHAGETLLVHGAAGGVGLAAVECGRAMGAMVIATARGEDRLQVAREHGADHVLDSTRADLGPAIKELTGGRGVDVVFDSVGGDLFEASLKAIAWEGRIVLAGFAGGEPPRIRAEVLLVKNASAVGFWWGSYRKWDPARLRDAFKPLFAWHAAGRIKPLVSHALPLERCAEALQLLAERKAKGKVVLCP